MIEKGHGRIEVTIDGASFWWQVPITEIEQSREPVPVDDTAPWLEFVPGPILKVSLAFDAETVERWGG